MPVVGKAIAGKQQQSRLPYRSGLSIITTCITNSLDWRGRYFPIASICTTMLSSSTSILIIFALNIQWLGIFGIVQLKFVDVSVVPDNGTKNDTKREENIEFR